MCAIQRRKRSPFRYSKTVARNLILTKRSFIVGHADSRQPYKFSSCTCARTWHSIKSFEFRQTTIFRRKLNFSFSFFFFYSSVNCLLLDHLSAFVYSSALQLPKFFCEILNETIVTIRNIEIIMWM